MDRRLESLLQIEAFNRIDNYLSKLILKTNSNPVGIIDDIRNGDMDSTKGTNKVVVWVYPVGMIFETDKFDLHVRYQSPCLLYSSNSGLFTTESNNGHSIPVARVLEEPTAIHPTLMAEWIYKGE